MTFYAWRIADRYQIQCDSMNEVFGGVASGCGSRTCGIVGVVSEG